MSIGRISGWKVVEGDRARLLARLPARYADVIADHVTLEIGERPARPGQVQAVIVGQADDEAGVQAMVVEIDGMVARPDGGIFHITWSLDRGRGRTPVQSNDVLAQLGWRPLIEPMPVRLRPEVWTG